MDADKQRAILELAAANVVVVPDHVAKCLHVDAADGERQLDVLMDQGRLTRTRVSHDAPACYSITQAGLDLAGSGLPVPVLDAGRLRHEVAGTWLWLAAKSGVFGAAQRVISRRELVAGGETADADVVLVTTAGWVPLHVVLSLPDRSWLERLLRRYGSDPRIAGWVFLAEDLEPARELIGRVARELGLAELSRVEELVLS